MDGLSGIPTYTPETQREKFEKGLINFWPRFYRFFNGLFYFIIKTTRNTVIDAIQQIFRW